jgi:hypothetical protein
LGTQLPCLAFPRLRSRRCTLMGIRRQYQPTGTELAGAGMQCGVHERTCEDHSRRWTGAPCHCHRPSRARRGQADRSAQLLRVCHRQTVHVCNAKNTTSAYAVSSHMLATAAGVLGARIAALEGIKHRATGCECCETYTCQGVQNGCVCNFQGSSIAKLRHGHIAQPIYENKSYLLL